MAKGMTKTAVKRKLKTMVTVTKQSFSLESILY